ncbi:uncharacterized protein RCO7_06258 [Rhynchosporium graminicola]|uniref:Reverse transcriptase n=1 Tax=Rhynchosporium graminicola TaxID=2792576 RepID=A0A1E1KWF5_9HELO|nr:uncharacterized protein RCO7_06258 [Rhynchosporium commune]
MSVLVNDIEEEFETPSRAFLLTTDRRQEPFCPDTGSSICLAEKNHILKHFPGLTTYAPPIAVRLTGVGPGPISQYCVDLPVVCPTISGSEIEFPPFRVYLIDKLPCKLLMGRDWLRANKLNFIWGMHGDVDRLTTPCGQAIALNSVKQAIRPSRAQVYSNASVVISPGQGLNIPVRHRPLPPLDHGYLLRPFAQADLPLTKFGSLVNGITDGSPKPIPFANFGQYPIQIPKGTVLGILEPCPSTLQNQEVLFNMADVFKGEGEDAEHQRYPDGFPFLVTPPEDDPDVQANISDHFGSAYQAQVQAIVNSHTSLFRSGLGCFNDGITMPVPFKDGISLDDLRQAPYPQSKKDREAMDSILDPMVKDGSLEPVPLGQPSPAASPAFLVYRNGKPRVVIDLRRVNTKLKLDGYPLPRQDTILSALGGATIYSSMDLTKSFFQQKLDPEDKWKVAMVTAHRGHEQLTVATMGLATTPSFFQHRMESLFGPYLWKFVLVYIDDIIVFSKTPADHLEHLDTALALLEKSGVTLSLSKCFFAQPSIQALGHYVSRLGLSTLQEKVEAIRTWEFPSNLSELETALGFFGYYRSFVPHYASVAAPLIELKTLGFRQAPTSRRKRSNFALATSLESLDNTYKLDLIPKKETQPIASIEDCRKAWTELKDLLCNAPVLAFPNYDKPFTLYTDGSKEFGFGAALHQEDDTGVERPIVYLSKSLTPAERNYWPTELETAALVWAIQKLPQYLDRSPFTVVTDHSAVLSSVDPAKAINKNSTRLANWRMFLSKWAPYMTIRHRAGKDHQNADALSRLPRREPADQTIYHTSKESMTVTTIRAFPVAVTDPEEHPSTLAATAIHLSETMVSQFRRELPRDKTFASVYNSMMGRLKSSPPEEPTTTFENFRLDPKTKLLWFRDSDIIERLCVPGKYLQRVLEIAHDNRAHVGSKRTYEYLRRHTFIPKLWKTTKEYVRSCPTCRMARPDTQIAPGQLMPIPPPMKPLSTLCMDFVTSLPESVEGHNAICTLTDQLTKWIDVVVGRDDWTASQWAASFFRQLYPQIGLPDKFISDRDPKFTSGFWGELCSLAKIQLAFTTAYNAKSDGQSERSNQTVIHALRCAINGTFVQSNWESLLPIVTLALNSSTNASTGFSPYELRYGRLPKSILEGECKSAVAQLTNKGAREFVAAHASLFDEAKDAISLAQARMKLSYDKKRRPLDLIPGTDRVYLKLAKGVGNGYRLLDNHTKLSFTKMGPYAIKRKISRLSYEIDLPDWLPIHPVITVDHLQEVIQDPYNRKIPEPGPLIQDGIEKFIIEKIEKKEMRSRQGYRTRQPFYFCRYLGYADGAWQPGNILREDVPDMVRKFEENLGPRRSRAGLNQR